MKIYIALFALLIVGNLQGQNLVKNWSFEDTISCVNYNGPPKLPCRHWFWATSGSSDYFSSVYGCGFTAVPSNAFGYQHPKSGIAYCGFSIYNIPPVVNYREYVEGSLTDTLIQGRHYCVSFYISTANNCKYITDDIGAYFSLDSIYEPDTNVLARSPQIMNTQGNILSDTLNWILIQGEFVAQGGEKYITIGNFKDDNNTTLATILGATQELGYYYIDDVSVTDCTVSIEELKNEQIKFILSPNPAKDKLVVKLENSKIKAEKYEIINSLGELVLQKAIFNLKNNQVEINVNALPRGIYFLKLLTDSGYATAKFVKE